MKRFVAIAFIAACVRPASNFCNDGRVCPEARVCDEIHRVCVLEEQLAACAGKLEGAPCTVLDDDRGQCQDGVCFLQECGDGVATGSEPCDGVDVPVDDCMDIGYHMSAIPTCAPDCTLAGCTSGLCGDGTHDADFEQCDAEPNAIVADCTDLGFYDAGDVTCNLCRFDDLQCTGFCGDGLLDSEELCDGAPPQTLACSDFGYDAGTLGCGNCAPTYAKCGVLRWDRVPSFTSTLLESVWHSGGSYFTVGRDGNLVRVTGDVVTKLYDGNVELYDVWASTPNDVYAVGKSGTVVHWDGTTATVSNPTTTDLRGVSGTASNNVYAVGVGGVIFHYDGASWTTVISPTTNALESVWADTTRVIAVGNAGTIVVDSGAGFNLITPAPVTANLRDVWGLWIVGHDNAVLRSTNGLVWTPQPIHRLDDPVCCTFFDEYDFEAVFAMADDDVYVAGAVEDVGAVFNGMVGHFDGKAWTIPPETPGPRMHALAGTSSRDVVVVGEQSVMLRFSGSVWGRIVYQGEPWQAVWGSAENDVYVAEIETAGGFSSGGYISRITVGGRTEVYNDSGDLDLHAIFGVSAAEVYAVGESGVIVSGSGSSWARTIVGTTTLRGVWGIAGDVFAVGDAGRILRRLGAGAWNQMSSNTGAVLNAVFGFGSSVFAVGAAGTIMRFNGTSWTAMTAPATTYALRSVWGSSASDVYAAGDAGTLFHFNGTAWSTVPTRLSNDITAVFGTAADDVFIATKLGEIAHFDGVAWARVQLDTNMQIRAIWGVARQIVFGGEDPFFFSAGVSHSLLRTVPWSCRATETACSDGVDDDCDGARDSDDPDC